MSISMSIPRYAQAGYGNYLDSTSVKNTVKKGNIFVKQRNNSVQSQNTSTGNMRQVADMIPDVNYYTAIAKAGIKATAEFYDSMSKRRNQEHLATNYQYQAMSYAMQAESAMLGVDSIKQDIRGATNDVYSVYRMGEYQALEQGLNDAQIIHNERARTAGSGVRMNSESKQEVYKTNQYSAQQNQWAIQENTESSAYSARMNVQKLMNSLSDQQMQIANLQAQEILAQGNAKASKIEAKAIKPFMNAIYTGAISFAQSVMNMKGIGG